MATVDDRQFGIARLYARAMLEVAEEQGASDSLLEEVTEMAAALEQQPELGAFLANPLIELEDRRESLEKIFRGRASDLLVDTLQVINRKGRSALLPTILEAYRLEHKELRKEVDVFVTSAVPLSDDLRRQLQDAANRYTGRKARLVEKVDADLLGGLIVRVGDDKVDNSVATSLGQLTESLTRRASQEILSDKVYTTDA